MTSFTNIRKVEKNSSGFTLLELLIVIAIIAILSIALVFMLNPAETLKKARDAQRISDLKTVKTAIGVMLTASSTPKLDSGSAICTTDTVGTLQVPPKIAYSVSPAPTLAGALAVGSDGAGAGFTLAAQYSSASAGLAGKIDGTGWIPVNLKALTGGTPISSFPVDPVNSIAGANPAATDLTYRYACQNLSLAAGKPSFIFELNTNFESNAYTVEDNKEANDGGDNSSMYESGNSLNLLPSTGAY